MEMNEIMDQKFFICEHCGKIVSIVKESGVPIICCGQKMKELIPCETDAACEKHVPVYEVNDGIVKVKVGSIEHPMTADHYIEWISLKTKSGDQRKELQPGDLPQVSFAICDGDEVEAAYAYCNLHNLWKS